ncbi:MAG: hypothetical protein ROW48_14255 [Bellilinea sp.]
MSNKYGSYQAKQQEAIREARNYVHPIWRGVGFLLMIITPVLGYFGALVLIEQNAKQNWFTIPPEFIAPGQDPMLYLKIGLTILIAFLLFFLFQLISLILLRAFGPSRYGPYDVPPVGYRGKKYKR